jgi:hypothetical protein
MQPETRPKNENPGFQNRTPASHPTLLRLVVGPEGCVSIRFPLSIPISQIAPPITAQIATHPVRRAKLRCDTNPAPA